MDIGSGGGTKLVLRTVFQMNDEDGLRRVAQINLLDRASESRSLEDSVYRNISAKSSNGSLCMMQGLIPSEVEESPFPLRNRFRAGGPSSRPGLASFIRERLKDRGEQART